MIERPWDVVGSDGGELGKVEEVVGDRLQVVRTPASLSGLTEAAASDGVIFAGAIGGGSAAGAAEAPSAPSTATMTRAARGTS